MDLKETGGQWLVNEGVILCELLTGQSPFFHNNKLKHIEQILSKELSKKKDGFENVSEGCFDFLNRLLEKKPENRLGMDIKEIKGHAFFEGIDWEKIYLKKGDVEWQPSECDLNEFKFFANVGDIEAGIGLEELDVLGEVASFSEEMGKGGFLPEFSFF